MGRCDKPALPHMVDCEEHTPKSAIVFAYKQALEGKLVGLENVDWKSEYEN
jgi:hypothetical protein